MPEFENLELVVDRIRNMEARFDRLLNDQPQKDDLAVLLDYYENGMWRADFELDEQGLLPKELKRGVLSEDGLYNLLQDCTKPSLSVIIPEKELIP